MWGVGVWICVIAHLQHSTAIHRSDPLLEERGLLGLVSKADRGPFIERSCDNI